MRKTALPSLIALLLSSGTPAPMAHAAGAHSHGIARLEVAVDGATVTLRLASPLESLLGFERAPRNDAERGQVRAMAQALRAGNPFVPTPAARCRLDKVDLASSVRYAEGLDEIEQFGDFRRWAFQAPAAELLERFNRPILPTQP